MDQPILGSDRTRPALFLYTSITALITIIACWVVALQFNLPTGMWCPPISLTGFLYPERGIYITGFTATFAVGMAALKQLRTLFTAEAGESSRLHKFSLRVLFVAFIGMLGQALVPFQSDTFTSEFPANIKPQTIVHLIFAAVFFYGAQIHAIAILFARTFNGNRLKLPVKCKTLFLAGNIFCLYFLNSLLSDSVNSEGVSQRLGVLCILAFFADYSRDLRKISSCSFCDILYILSHLFLANTPFL